MPSVNIHIPEVTQSITRPVTIAIADQVKKFTKIPNDTVIIFPGDSEKVSQSLNNRDAVFSNDKKLFIEVEENYHADSLASTAVSRIEHAPIFIDYNLGVYVKPIYSTMTVTINFRYRSQSKTEITKWLNDIRIAISNNREINIHDVSYHYLVPDEVFELLNVIHQLKERVEPYNENLTGYLTRGFSTNITKVSDTIGQTSGYAIAETQGRIQGMFEFSPLPDKPENNQTDGTYVASFSYRLTYDKPLAINIQYPVMVHNQLLPPRYIKFNTQYPRQDNVARSYSVSGDALSLFEQANYSNIYCDPRGVPRLPENDEFIPDTVNYPGTASEFYALVSVDTDKRTLLNLRDIEPLVIDDDILEFIRDSERPYITKPYKSVFILSLYKNKSGYDSSKLELLDDLTFKTKEDLYLRNTHRVELSLVVDLFLLDKDALLRLKKYPKVFFKILMAINEALRKPLSLRNVKSTRFIDYQYLLELFAIKASVDITNFYKNFINEYLITETNREVNCNGQPNTKITNWANSTEYSSNVCLNRARVLRDDYNRLGNKHSVSSILGKDLNGREVDSFNRSYGQHGDVLNRYLDNLRFNNVQRNHILLSSLISAKKPEEKPAYT